MTKKTFESDLAELIVSFLKLKKSVGLKYETDEYYLHQFDEYFLKEKSKSKTKSLKIIIKKWIILRNTENSVTQRRRIATIRQFGKYLMDSNYPDPFIIPNKICQKQSRTLPHFFTNNEIIKFFTACDSLKQCNNSSVRHYVLPILFRVLYCCGLRTCEARKILVKDVDFTNKYIDIINSKGLKSRRIFIHQELATLLEKYDAKINCLIPERTYFFPVKKESCYSNSSISYNFNKIWCLANLKKEPNKRIRAYDMRHHFAFANINRWTEEGINVNAMLPYLMRYMGHSSLDSTLYYVHLVPEFFSTLNNKTKALEDLLPEVTYE
jgi:integrase